MIGLTGGIGSGKSTVAQIFRSLGIPVYESDVRARELMNSDPEMKVKIIDLFGVASFSAEGLDRKYIADKVFKDKILLEKLNAIVHPLVKADAIRWANEEAQSKSPYVIKESAILFEEELTKELDAIILVVADEKIRIDRVAKRDIVSEAQVRERMQHQWPDEKKIPMADYVIYNDEERSLIEQVTDIDKMIRYL